MAEKPPTSTRTASGRDLVTKVPAGRPAEAPPTRVGIDQVLAHAVAFAAERSSFGPGTVMILVLAVCVVTVTSLTGMILLGLGIVAAFTLVVLGGLLSVGISEARGRPRLLAEERRREGVDARSRAPGRFEAMVPDTHPDWLPLFRSIHAIIKDEAALAIADDMAFRLRDLHAAYEKAVADAGRSDVTVIKARAIDATVAIVEDARARHQDVDAAIRRQDEARVPQVTRAFEETARSIAGLPSAPSALPPPSASAALQRLIGLAEDALAVDPDLVDAQGARVDALIRQHLPRLLEAHADAARSSGSDLSAVDAQLADGVEQVRASVDEALAMDARARFDRLRTEVGFLRMRRGG